jgi:hypothetical protein
MLKTITLAIVATALVSLSAHAATEHNHEHGHEHNREQEAAPPRPLVTLSILEALKETASQASTADVVAYRALVDASDIEVSVYSKLNQAEARKTLFACHGELDTHGDLTGAHCHDEGTSAGFAYKAPAKLYSVDELSLATDEALRIFASHISPLSTLTELKLWHTGHNLSVKFAYIDSSAAAPPGTLKLSYAMCHYHGDHIDCHRSRSVGADEPQD